MFQMLLYFFRLRIQYKSFRKTDFFQKCNGIENIADSGIKMCIAAQQYMLSVLHAEPQELFNVFPAAIAETARH